MSNKDTEAESVYSIGNIVVYGSAGICRVDDIRDEKFNGEIKKYFILKPLFDDKNTFFVPSFNELLMAKVRPILTVNEARELVDRLPDIQPEWESNDKLRTEKYKEILESGDRVRIIAILKGLNRHLEYLNGVGKKKRSSDEILMRKARSLIENELTHILGDDCKII